MVVVVHVKSLYEVEVDSLEQFSYGGVNVPEVLEGKHLKTEIENFETKEEESVNPGVLGG